MQDQLLKRALSFLFSCPIVNESSCTRVRDQEAPGKGGFPADVRWTAIALYLRTSVAACWQRFLKLAEARHRAARWGLQPNDKQASLPVHSETAESSAGGEFPAPPADAATEEKWWTSAPENRVRLDPKEPEPQIPDVLYSPTPTDSAAAARPPLPLHAITLELLHLLHTGVRAPPTLLVTYDGTTHSFVLFELTHQILVWHRIGRACTRAWRRHLASAHLFHQNARRCLI
jgi:hypothetical protein